MLKLVSVGFAMLAVAAAINIDYLGNDIEYDVQPNIIKALPYPYFDGYVGNRVVHHKPNPVYVPSSSVIVTDESKPSIVATKLGLITTGVSFAISYVKKAVWFLVKNLSSLILGSGIALGICKFTSLCDKGHTLIELQREIRSFATPQRLARATEIVEKAIKQYSDMQ